MNEHAGVQPLEMNCYLCGSSKKKLVSVESDHPISKCLKCGFLYVNKIPPVKDGKVIGEYYSDDKTESGSDLKEIEVNMEHLQNGLKKYESVTEFLLNEIQKRKSSGKLLDVGCGFGALMVAAEGKGFEVYGTELSQLAVNFIRKTTSIKNIECSILHEEIFEGVKFDSINLTNVLEHVPNPTQILLDCRDRLADCGLLIVRVPNMSFHKIIFLVDSILVRFKLQKKHRFSLLASSPPIHLGGFSCHTLKSSLKKSGFVDIEVKPSKLSGFTNKKFIYRIFEFLSNLVFWLSAKQFNVCPTIIAFAKIK